MFGATLRCPVCNRYTPDRCTCGEKVPHKSIAEWPEGTMSDSYGRCRSEDTHESKQAAESVCLLLEVHGFGGQHEVYPLRTWVEPIS